MTDKLLEVVGLKHYFFTKPGVVKAIDDVSFYIGNGEALGLVGESGCGKTTVCLSILRLVPDPGRVLGGQILFDGQDLLTLSDTEMQKYRGDQISMVFQDPLSALNPVLSVGYQIAEPILAHRKIRAKEAWTEVKEILEAVGIPRPDIYARAYPHQLSGGMRQRAVAAMALSCQPRLLIADEPTTMLDTTTQARFLELLKDIQRDSGISILLVTHDLNTVSITCDRVLVMYAGRIVEGAYTKELFVNPAHPYTNSLIESIPTFEMKGKKLKTAEGSSPDLCNLPSGCYFSSRCDCRMDICQTEYPPKFMISPDHYVNCWLAE